MTDQPNITVGIMDQETEVLGRLNGNFSGGNFDRISGRFSAKSVAGMIVLFDEALREICRSPSVRLKVRKESSFRLRQGAKARSGKTFTLFNVTIGNRFHWERKEDQTFQGDLILLPHEDGNITAVNEIPLEDYLTSVISSEMSAQAPMEFLKAHAILSRSWLLASLDRRKKIGGGLNETRALRKKEGEWIRWYDREDHDLFDVCADDHCQRYQGITKIISKQAEEAVEETQGMVITFQDKVCDARYSKACGGFTEEFNTAWNNKRVPYLRSISDASVPHPSIQTEEEARTWILSDPEAYCNTKDKSLLKKILPGFDRQTKNFFRWTVEYSQGELKEILREKSGFDIGTLKGIEPLQRGPSGRISRLKIIGSKRKLILGKELEIRRWLSRTHLYSSAFVVMPKCNLNGEVERFILKGAGWGHGVGLCQIGAAVMATKGFSAGEILKHYFHGVKIKKIY